MKACSNWTWSNQPASQSTQQSTTTQEGDGLSKTKIKVSKGRARILTFQQCECPWPEHCAEHIMVSAYCRESVLSHFALFFIFIKQAPRVFFSLKGHINCLGSRQQRFWHNLLYVLDMDTTSRPLVTSGFVKLLPSCVKEESPGTVGS